MTGWPEGWTKPVWRKRRGPFKGYFSPLTPTKLGGSVKKWGFSVTSTGRVYFLGAYLFDIRRNKDDR